ncbi:MAG: hypothetical protein KF746_22310 [Chitinophagaceae bacterium]|nr:hypothetical protein [Chitinophagaceae bacterium]
MVHNQYLPVNWVDGMKINKKRFIEEYNAAIYQLAQHTSSFIDEQSYGLLPPLLKNNYVKLFISTDNQKRIQVRLKSCRAITPGGYYIEFDDDNPLQHYNTGTGVTSEPATLRDLRNKSSEFYIVLTINPYERVPFGSADINELPPRIPFVKPLLQLDIIPVNEVVRNALGPAQIPVGKMMVEVQKVSLDEDYIPPCASVNSHPELLLIHHQLREFYEKMEAFSLHIMQKIIQKKQTSEQAVIVNRICENVIQYTATQLSEIQSSGIVQKPVFVITRAIAMARIIKNVLDCYTGSGKEALVNYFSEWCNVKQGELESIIGNLSALQYNHLDINDAVGRIAVFTKTISRLFSQLEKLDLIGNKKGGFFVNEKSVSNEPEVPQRRRSFLAD